VLTKIHDSLIDGIGVEIMGYLERVVRGIPSTLPKLEDTPILSELPGAKVKRVKSEYGYTVKDVIMPCARRLCGVG
jgi:hypothetical protein